MWPGQGMSFKVNEIVHTARSDFQVGAWRDERWWHAMHVLAVVSLTWCEQRSRPLLRDAWL